MSDDFFGNVTKDSSSAGSNPRVFYKLCCLNNSVGRVLGEGVFGYPDRGVGGSNPSSSTKGLRESLKGINNLSLSMPA
jgi:hypothetical protein